jgi:hypothetical protein
MFIFSSLALANRSAVLFKLAEYARCVEDIELALEAGYPPSLRYKVAERRLRCSLRLSPTQEKLAQDLLLVCSCLNFLLTFFH